MFYSRRYPAFMSGIPPSSSKKWENVMTRKSSTFITSAAAATLLSSGGWVVSGGPGVKDWAPGFVGKEIGEANVGEINLNVKIGPHASLGCFSIPLEKDTKFDRPEPHVLHVMCPTMQKTFHPKQQGGGKNQVWLKFVNLRLKEGEVTRKRQQALKKLGVAGKEVVDLKVADGRRQIDAVLSDGTILRIQGSSLYYTSIHPR
ncbi:MAG: hypothetical protein AAB919_01685 [Patescibacteria group bacterium]